MLAGKFGIAALRDDPPRSDQLALTCSQGPRPLAKAGLASTKKLSDLPLSTGKAAPLREIFDGHSECWVVLYAAFTKYT